VYYGIEPNNKLENNYSLKPNIRKIGTVARIVPQKDFPTLIDAFILVNQEFPRTQLVVAGVGKEKENIIQIVGYFDIRNKIHWLGKIDNISKVFKQMDLFILSSNSYFLTKLTSSLNIKKCASLSFSKIRSIANW
jgi:glycosyltransferase involved in cell wall biosynthesis